MNGMPVARVVGEGFAGEQFAGQVSIDGLVRMHWPFAQLREANGQREK